MRRFSPVIFDFLYKHSGKILGLLAIGGVGGTAVFSGKAAIKAHEKIKEAEKEKKAPLTTKEKVMTTATTFILPASVGVGTVVCILGMGILNKRKQASLVSSYALISKTFNSYKKKIVEKYGKKEHDNIMDEIILERADEKGVKGFYYDTTSVDTDNDEIRAFYDVCSDRPFESTYANVLQAEYMLNRALSHGEFVSQKQWFEWLGLGPDDISDRDSKHVGWLSNDTYHWVDFDNRERELEDGLRVIFIEPLWGPEPPEVYEGSYFKY